MAYAPAHMQTTPKPRKIAAIRSCLQGRFILPLLDWLYPRFCLICETRMSGDNLFLCDACWADLPRNRDNAMVDLRIIREGKASPFLQGFMACYVYEERMKKIIHGLKYEGKTRIVAELMRHAWPFIARDHILPAVDILLPVPLHPKRKKERGFNQSFLIAKRLGHYLGVPARENLLLRARYTVSQTTLNAEERLQNVRDAFTLTAKSSLSGKSVMLVDDLITTGSTLNTCARVLIEAGAKDVFAFAIARA